MCIVQRYALIGVALLCAVAAVVPLGRWRWVTTAAVALLAGFGAFVAALVLTALLWWRRPTR